MRSKLLPVMTKWGKAGRNFKDSALTPDPSVSILRSDFCQSYGGSPIALRDGESLVVCFGTFDDIQYQILSEVERI